MLELFWELCKECKPEMDDPHSFYTIDNDSLLAGFSPIDNVFNTGNEVLNWVINLRNKLLISNIKVTFSLNLLFLNGVEREEWATYPGIERLTRDFLYIPDEMYAIHGALRPCLVGDSLIITARLLQLAKTLGSHIILSIFPGGHADVNEIARQHSNIDFQHLSQDMYNILGPDKRYWLVSRNVEAWTIDFK